MGSEQNERRHASYTLSEYLWRPIFWIGRRLHNKGQRRTFALEGEVFGKVATFVVASQQYYPIWVGNFEGVKI